METNFNFKKKKKKEKRKKKIPPDIAKECVYTETDLSPMHLGFCAKFEEEGFKMKGADGNLWIMRTDENGVKHWVEYESEIPKKPRYIKPVLFPEPIEHKKFLFNKRNIFSLYAFIKGPISDQWIDKLEKSNRYGVINFRGKQIRLHYKNIPYIEDIANAFPDKAEMMDPKVLYSSYCEKADLIMSNITTKHIHDFWEIPLPGKYNEWISIVLDIIQNNFVYGSVYGYSSIDKLNRSYGYIEYVELHEDYQKMGQCRPLFTYCCQQINVEYIIFYIQSNEPKAAYMCYIKSGLSLKYKIYMEQTIRKNDYIEIISENDIHLVNLNNKIIIFITNGFSDIDDVMIETIITERQKP